MLFIEIYGALYHNNDVTSWRVQEYLITQGVVNQMVKIQII